MKSLYNGKIKVKMLFRKDTDEKQRQKVEEKKDE